MLKRLAILLAFASLAALAVTSSAPAGDIADEPCPDAAGPDTATCPTGTTGTPYSVTIKLKEGSGCGPASPPKWRVSSGSLPPGLTLSSNGTAGGHISGTPTQAGNFSFYITVENPYREDPPGTVVCIGDFSDKRFTIPIVPGLPKLTLGPESTAPGTVGTAYSLQMTATVGESKTWSISSGALPPGMTIDATTGLISGTPTAPGQFDFQVFAKMNSDSRSDTKSLGIVVRDALGVLGSDPFTPARRALAEVSLPFEAMLAASGGTGVYTWSLTTGELPDGLTLADGAIAGMPTTAGVYNFTASVLDSEGRIASYPARIVVAAKLAIATPKLRLGKVGRVYRAKIATFGGVKPNEWRVVRGPLPRGVFFDRTTGVLAGVPTRPGRFRMVFEVTDALGATTRKFYVVTVQKAVIVKKKKRPA